VCTVTEIAPKSELSVSIVADVTPDRFRYVMRALIAKTLHTRFLTLAVATVALFACSGNDQPIGVDPLSVTRVNLRLERIVVTQVVQNDDGSLPLVAGSAAAVNVVVVRSVESVTEVPVVLRLFRGASVVFTDTAVTGGVLGPLTSTTSTNAQFLIPANFVASDVSWQVELDPARTQPDSSRSDNLLPSVTPAAFNTVAVTPLRLRLVPVILSRHGGATGDVTPINAESYVKLARQIFPVGTMTVTVGAPLAVNANFAAAAGQGGDSNFWGQLLSEISAERSKLGPTDEYWYGVVQLPEEYDRVTFGGFAYIPLNAEDTGPFSRIGAGFGVSRRIDLGSAQRTLAHELGHNFGRFHAPGCNAVAPIDPAYRGTAGTISAIGNDVWSWANGFSRGAESISRETGDVMSYCSPKWIGPDMYGAILAWRQVAPVLGSIGAVRESVAVP
jgi:hypothetical protein